MCTDYEIYYLKYVSKKLESNSTLTDMVSTIFRTMLKDWLLQQNSAKHEFLSYCLIGFDTLWLDFWSHVAHGIEKWTNSCTCYTSIVIKVFLWQRVSLGPWRSHLTDTDRLTGSMSREKTELRGCFCAVWILTRNPSCQVTGSCLPQASGQQLCWIWLKCVFQLLVANKYFQTILIPDCFLIFFHWAVLFKCVKKAKTHPNQKNWNGKWERVHKFTKFTQKNKNRCRWDGRQ